MATFASPNGESTWTRAAQQLTTLLRRLRGRPPRRLRLCESLALGERRFLAVVEFERQRFLIGGTPSSVALLAHLPDADRRNAAGQIEAGEADEFRREPGAVREVEEPEKPGCERREQERRERQKLEREKPEREKPERRKQGQERQKNEDLN